MRAIADDQRRAAECDHRSRERVDTFPRSTSRYSSPALQSSAKAPSMPAPALGPSLATPLPKRAETGVNVLLSAPRDADDIDRADAARGAEVPISKTTSAVEQHARCHCDTDPTARNAEPVDLLGEMNAAGSAESISLCSRPRKRARPASAAAATVRTQERTKGERFTGEVRRGPSLCRSTSRRAKAPCDRRRRRADQRIRIEKITRRSCRRNGCKAKSAEFGAGPAFAIMQGCPKLQESGAFVKLMPPGEDPAFQWSVC